MTGVITMREVACHPMLVIRGFGFRVFLRCVVAAARGRRCTFLEIACSTTCHKE